MATTKFAVDDGVTAAVELRVRLRHLRRQRGLSQRDLSKSLYLASHTPIVDYESGRRVPAPDIIEAYERFFGLAKGELQRLRSRAVSDRAATEAASALAVLASKSSVPHQLPAPARHFTGRESELAILDALLASTDQSTVVISAIGGMGGIGKTALAVEWGNRVRKLFPDGELYVDLRGFHPAGIAMSPVDALEFLLHSLGVSGSQMPSGRDERIGLYRSLLAPRRMLLVLDNASSAAQVRPLLPGRGGCVVVVTSRDRLAGLVSREGAQRLVLDVFQPDEARQLLRATIGGTRADDEPEATVDLAERCGWHPLALRVAAERISAEGTSIAATATQLAERGDRLDVLATQGDDESTIRSVLGWSYDRLSPRAARVFRLLGLHDGPHLSIGAIAVLTGVDFEQLDEPLSELVTAHLVAQLAPDRYGCHDLLQLYANDLARMMDDREQHAARQRLAGWYLHSACAARTALSPSLPPMDPEAVDLPAPPMSFANAVDAATWFETERANLLAITRMARSQGWHRVGWQVPTAMYGFFDLRKCYADWLASHEIALECAQLIGDREAQGRILCNMGNAYRPMRRNEEAIECYAQALELFEHVGYRQGQAKVWGNVGSSYDALQRWDEAFDAHHRSLDIFRDIGDRFGEALTLTNLGEIHKAVDQHPEAAERHRRALEIFEEIGDEHAASRARVNLGVALASMGDVETGLALARQALSGYHTFGDRYEAANVLAHLGDMHAQLGQPESAATCWREALRLYEQVGDAVAAGHVRALFNRRS